jgi:hypothetical protein
MRYLKKSQYARSKTRRWIEDAHRIHIFKWLHVLMMSSYFDMVMFVCLQMRKPILSEHIFRASFALAVVFGGVYVMYPIVVVALSIRLRRMQNEISLSCAAP